MHKILIAAAGAALGTLALAGPASATYGPGHGGSGDTPSADNKPITFCHATSSATNPYVKITTNVAAFYQAGHIDHEGDIWNAFTYTTKGGDTVTVLAQGDTDLLAFDDCKKPKEDEVITVPEPTFSDVCGTENDTFAVAPGKGYTVGDVTTDGLTKSAVVTAAEGYTFPDKTKTVTLSHTFTNEDCGLPDTGGKALHNTAGGIGAGAAVILGTGALVLTRRRRTNA